MLQNVLAADSQLRFQRLMGIDDLELALPACRSEVNLLEVKPQSCAAELHVLATYLFNKESVSERLMGTEYIIA